VRTVVVTVMLGAIVVIVPLAFTSQGILASATRQSEARETVETWLEDSTLELERVSVDGSEVDIRLSGEGEVPSVPDLEQDLEENLGTDVVVQVEYFPSVVITSDDA
jgi:uncharacterized membrane protein